MPFRDSVDKIVGVYLASVTSEVFEYQRVRYSPLPIRISPTLFRGFECVARCGGCCPRFTLDFLPGEHVPRRIPVEMRRIYIDGRSVSVASDTQEDSSGHFCRNLDPFSGRCRIYAQRPFSCDFEPIRFVRRKSIIQLGQRMYGRGWAMKRIDGGRGARCVFTNEASTPVEDIVLKFQRLADWASHFRIRTRIPQIIEWCQNGDHSRPILLKEDGSLVEMQSTYRNV